jgi:hypothetical protein
MDFMNAGSIRVAVVAFVGTSRIFIRYDNLFQSIRVPLNIFYDDPEELHVGFIESSTVNQCQAL